jgi:hypothetical protein
MQAPIGDTFHAVCIIAPAGQIDAARQGAWEFHKQDFPRFTDTVEMMLTVPLSPTGSVPATHYICTRHDTLEALGRIEVYQQAIESAGKPRVPVTLHVAKNALNGAGDHKNQLSAHESSVLAELGLRRIA